MFSWFEWPDQTQLNFKIKDYYADKPIKKVITLRKGLASIEPHEWNVKCKHENQLNTARHKSKQARIKPDYTTTLEISAIWLA